MIFNTKVIYTKDQKDNYTNTMRSFFNTLTLTIALACSSMSYAARWTWTGANSNNYDTKSNWITTSGSSRPQNGDDIIINAGATNQPRLSNNRTVKTMTINGGSFDLRNSNLTISDTLYFNGGSFTNTSNNGNSDLNADVVILNAISTVSIISPETINFYVDGNMRFLGGVLQTDANNLLIFEDNATATDYSNNSHVDGPVRKVGNDVFTFPIGNGTFLGAIGISDFASNSTTQHHTTRYSYSAPNGTLNGGGNISQKEQWSMQRSAANRTLRYTVTFNQHQRSGRITDSTDLAVAVYNGSSWNPISSSVSGNRSVGALTTNTRVTGNIQAITISAPLGLNPLPVKLINYNVVLLQNTAKITWSTVGELNNDYFNLEKSVDGINWTSIAMIDGQLSSDNVINYEFTDANLVQGMQFYRLSQTDINGESETFNVLSLDVIPASVQIQAYPNPTNGIIHIELNQENTENTSVKVLNSMSQLVMENNQPENNRITLDLTSLDAGIYFIQVNNGVQTETIRIVRN